MKRILHNLYKMTAAALAVALLLGNVSATFLGNWLKKNQLELSDTASLTHGTLLMTGKTTKQTESILNNLEEKIGCVARSKAHKKTLEQIRDWAAAIEDLGDPAAASLAAKILAAVHDIKE